MNLFIKSDITLSCLCNICNVAGFTPVKINIFEQCLYRELLYSSLVYNTIFGLEIVIFCVCLKHNFGYLFLFNYPELE